MKFLVAQAFLLILAASSAFAAQCTFEIIVRTDDRRGAGTDARVSLQLSSVDGQTLEISDLESWGLMGRGHNYLEKGNADRFRGTGECMTTGPCKMLLTSDGTGGKPGWYVRYVQVAQVGQDVSVKQRKFAVDQWLAVDEAPHQLFAFRDGCGTALVKP